MTYYTLQITFQNGKDVSTEEFKDLQPGETPFNQWARQLRDNLYRTGFNLETAPGTVRFVSPFHIHDAYLIKQDKKHSIQ